MDEPIKEQNMKHGGACLTIAALGGGTGLRAGSVT
jgi:hypothetical protein